ncbi:nucleotidyltransferase domain-containing protein [Oscillatoria sp. CS-180]|uniref:nucleotidyltransferase domain-containing protein n=1 Tax=Oscillatoria sp. CS-180 TaxID=3021720 RepID=UPI00232D4B25|nr:nucleotidyltransferase domain-containing protein [Oscillatoria sp. CS-180]MDB9525098.1 nucleotidyltransferase domain-containing protein [Oscillatoria sp. CS-180]
MLPIPPEKMAEYRAAAKRRHQDKRDRLKVRYQLAQQVAQQAAEMLKQDFQADRVVLFGSMLSDEFVHERSDIDLVAWGINPSEYYRAVGRLQGLDSRFAIDLIEGEAIPPRLVSAIEAGRAL